MVAEITPGKLELNSTLTTAGLYYLSNSFVTHRSFPSISTLRKSKSLGTLYYLNISRALGGDTHSLRSLESKPC